MEDKNKNRLRKVSVNLFEEDLIKIGDFIKHGLVNYANPSEFIRTKIRDVVFELEDKYKDM